MPTLCEVTGALKTAFIESWISLFGKMNRAFDKDMPTKIWLCYVIVVSICCARNNRPAWASIQNVSRPVGTTPISSVFWLGLIRCDYPGGEIHVLDWLDGAVQSFSHGSVSTYGSSGKTFLSSLVPHLRR